MGLGDTVAHASEQIPLQRHACAVVVVVVVHSFERCHVRPGWRLAALKVLYQFLKSLCK